LRDNFEKGVVSKDIIFHYTNMISICLNGLHRMP